MNFEKAKAAYIGTAIVVFNLLLLFIALNISASAALHIRNSFSAPAPVAEKNNESKLPQVYPGKSAQEIRDLLSETRSLPYEYEAFTQFKERPFNGHYINIDAHGFRHSVNQAPWPPDPNTFNIFLFGSSTAFGYGVADAETIPSYLQQELRAHTSTPVAVYNFARGYYYSTQERALFEKLIEAGSRPKLAIFIDGMNEFYFWNNRPMFTQRLQDYIASGDANRTGRKALLDLVSHLPVVRLGERFVSEPKCAAPNCSTPAAVEKMIEPEAAARIALNRYRSNKKMIEAVAAAFDVTTLFVWQPVPTYGYDQKSHLFAGASYRQHALSGVGYAMLAAERPKDPIPGNFLWCADLQESRHEPLYVDQVHYTAAFSKVVASCIAEQIMSRGLLASK